MAESAELIRLLTIERIGRPDRDEEVMWDGE